MTESDLTRTIVQPVDERPYEPMPRREWLVTNGLGGYASGTVAGAVTRRYHGLLVASLPARPRHSPRKNAPFVSPFLRCENLRHL